jgi:hypothetical protein
MFNNSFFKSKLKIASNRKFKMLFTLKNNKLNIFEAIDSHQRCNSREFIINDIMSVFSSICAIN